MKSGYDELRDLTRRLFEKELLEAEAKGYLVMYRGILYDAQEQQLMAEVDFVKEEIVYPGSYVYARGTWIYRGTGAVYVPAYCEILEDDWELAGEE